MFIIATLFIAELLTPSNSAFSARPSSPQLWVSGADLADVSWQMVVARSVGATRRSTVRIGDCWPSTRK